jgi:hypothetical protein
MLRHSRCCVFNTSPGHSTTGPTVTDQLASGREVILFDYAGIGRSTGRGRETVAAMATHTFAFPDGLGSRQTFAFPDGLGSRQTFAFLDGLGSRQTFALLDGLGSRQTFAFLDGRGLDSCDVLRFSLGGMIA